MSAPNQETLLWVTPGGSGLLSSDFEQGCKLWTVDLIDIGAWAMRMWTTFRTEEGNENLIAPDRM